MLKTVDRYTTDSRPILRRQSMVDVSAECRPLYRPRYLPIVGRYVGRYLSWYIGRYVDRHISVDILTDTRLICRPTYRLTLGRYVDQYICRELVDMSTDISVQGCTKYTWSESLCAIRERMKATDGRLSMAEISTKKNLSQINDTIIS